MVSTADLVGIITQHFFETLFTFDRNWKVTPLLAEAMPEISADGKVYTIKLRQGVTFHDGSESEAVLIKAWPENDLAVLKAKKIPDDLPAATLGSTANLRPGDEVVAVGFPYGIGPSVSAGVVSGLNREFLSPKGKRVLTRLIQFDAAANPGNSGGPLVTMEGEVVGIVTAILSPNGAGTFIGIGFATTIEAAGGAVGIPPF
jgi:S1-C subfamily serine protease